MVKRKEYTQKSSTTFLGRVIDKLLKIPVFILKAVYILPLFLFGIWLLQLLYLPRLEAIKIMKVIQKEEQKLGIFKAILMEQKPVTRSHFHMIDKYISQPETNAPLCLTCHGTYPHSKEKKIRSILNFHTGFMACSVCHARQKRKTKDIIFKWVDRKSGEILNSVKGEYGKYPAKIFPIKIDGQGKKIIFRPVDDKAARQYLLIKDKYTPDQVAMAKIKLHEHISEKPVFCYDCHKKNGYLNFMKLGFPIQRINHLNSSEVVGMIEKYKTFYLPTEINFGVEKVFK